MRAVLASLCAVASTACVFDGNVPTPAHVRCSGGGDCPGALVCVASVGECRPAQALLGDPPGLEQAAVTPAVARPGDVVTATFSVAGALAGPPTVYAGALAFVGADADGTWTFTATIPDDAVDGALAVFVDVVAEAGPAARGLVVGDVTVDGTAPSLLADSTGIDPPVGRPGAVTSIRVAFDEDVADSIRLTSGADALAPSANRGGLVTFALTPSSSGVLSLAITGIVDAAGNAAPDASLGDYVVDADAPVVSGLAVDRAVYGPAHPTVTATFTVSEVASVSATIDGAALSCSAIAPDVLVTCTGPASSSGTAGARALDVEARDSAGNAGVASITVLVDDTAPGALAGASVVVTPGPAAARTDVSAAGAGAVVGVTFSTDEIPAVLPALSVDGHAATVTSLGFTTFSSQLAGDDLAEGTHDVVVHLVDDADNAADVTLDAVVVVDRTPPAPPAGLVVERFPWGADETAGAALTRVRADGTAEPGAIVALFDNPSPPRASLGVIGDVLDLGAVDRVDVFAEQIDAAGNASAAVRIDDGLVVMTFGTSSAGNPSALHTVSRLGTAIADERSAVGAASGGAGTIRAGDGAAVTSSAGFAAAVFGGAFPSTSDTALVAMPTLGAVCALPDATCFDGERTMALPPVDPPVVIGEGNLTGDLTTYRWAFDPRANQAFGVGLCSDPTHFFQDVCPLATFPATANGAGLSLEISNHALTYDGVAHRTLLAGGCAGCGSSLATFDRGVVTGALVSGIGDAPVSVAVDGAGHIFLLDSDDPGALVEVSDDGAVVQRHLLPDVRNDAVIAFDNALGEILLAGGGSADTYAWNGTDWDLLTSTGASDASTELGAVTMPAGPPALRTADGLLVFDDASSSWRTAIPAIAPDLSIVASLTTYRGEAWAASLGAGDLLELGADDTWTPRAQITEPATIVADDVDDALFLLGDASLAQYQDDATLTFLDVSPGHALSATWDEAHARIVADFGAGTLAAWTAQDSWVPLADAVAPPDCTVAYDKHLARVLVVGGTENNFGLGFTDTSTFALDDVDATTILVPGLEGRARTGVTHDPVTGDLLVVGGFERDLRLPVIFAQTIELQDVLRLHADGSVTSEGAAPAAPTRPIALAAFSTARQGIIYDMEGAQTFLLAHDDKKRPAIVATFRARDPRAVPNAATITSLDLVVDASGTSDGGGGVDVLAWDDVRGLSRIAGADPAVALDVALDPAFAFVAGDVPVAVAPAHAGVDASVDLDRIELRVRYRR